MKILAQACHGSGQCAVIPNRACWVYTRGIFRGIGPRTNRRRCADETGSIHPSFRVSHDFVAVCGVAQENSLAKDPVFRSARKAQQEGRLAKRRKFSMIESTRLN